MAVSEAQKRATAKYEKENYDKVLVRFSKGTKKRIERQSESINAYIIQAVIERLEADEDETLQEPIQIAQNAEIKPETVKADKYIKDPGKSEIKANTTPQQDGNTEEQKIAELQAMIDRKKAEQERRKAEKEAEKERQRQKEAEELADGIRKLQQEQKERKEKELAEDRAKFEQFDEDKIKAMLNDKEFRACVANPIYEADFVKNYGICNYERVQKCLQEIEDEEKESERKESIASVNCPFLER